MRYMEDLQAGATRYNYVVDIGLYHCNRPDFVSKLYIKMYLIASAGKYVEVTRKSPSPTHTQGVVPQTN